LSTVIIKSAWHPVVHLVGTGDIDPVVLVFAGQTGFATTLDLSLPVYGGDRPFYRAMVERCEGPSWLCDDGENVIVCHDCLLYLCNLFTA